MAYDLQKNQTMTRGWRLITYKLALLSAVTFFGLAQADQLPSRARPSSSICQDASHLQTGEWLILDLDGTIFTEAQQLGRDRWHDRYLEKLIQVGVRPDSAKEELHKLTVEIKNSSQVQLTEADLALKIRSLQKRGVIVLGFTGRPPGMARTTLARLRSFGIHFESSQYPMDQLSKIDWSEFPKHIQFANGVFFLNATNKGVALKTIFSSLDEKPESVSIFEDQERNLKPFTEALNEAHVAGAVYHYTPPSIYSEEEQMKMAHLQLTDFLDRGRRAPIMSDTAAYRRLFSGAKVCKKELE